MLFLKSEKKHKIRILEHALDNVLSGDNALSGDTKYAYPSLRLFVLMSSSMRVFPLNK